MLLISNSGMTRVRWKPYKQPWKMHIRYATFANPCIKYIVASRVKISLQLHELLNRSSQSDALSAQHPTVETTATSRLINWRFSCTVQHRSHLVKPPRSRDDRRCRANTPASRIHPDAQKSAPTGIRYARIREACDAPFGGQILRNEVYAAIRFNGDVEAAWSSRNTCERSFACRRRWAKAASAGASAESSGTDSVNFVIHRNSDTKYWPRNSATVSRLLQ